MLPESVKTSFIGKDAEHQKLVDDLTIMISAGDIGSSDDVTLKIISDLRFLNTRNKNDAYMFEPFWDGVKKVIELDGCGAHRRRHDEGDLEQTTKVSYVPMINTFQQLSDATKKYLLDEGLIEGEDFKIPSNEWIRRNFAASRDSWSVAERMTGKLPFKRTLQSRSSRSFHIHAHYCAQLKKIWRDHLSRVRQLLEKRDEDLESCHDLLPWYAALKGIGLDDKAGIPCAIDNPISAVKSNCTRAFVHRGGVVFAADHDFGCHKISASVLSSFNIGTDPGESLFSGGSSGRGEISVHLHDAIFDPSSSFHHARTVIDHLREESAIIAHQMEVKNNSAAASFPKNTYDDLPAPWRARIDQCMPYKVLIKADGGPDHNIKHVRTMLSLLALFILGKMDRLTAIRVCPGHSYLNTVECCMAILNLGLSNLALSLDPNMPLWIRSILCSCNSMKQVRKEIGRYDADLQKAIHAKEKQEARHLANQQIVEAEDDGDRQVDDEVQVQGLHHIGHKVRAFFDTYGWFDGSVSHIDVDAEDGKIYTIEFEDGEVYRWTHKELNDHKKQAAIDFGAVGWQFVKEFPKKGGGVMRCSGTVKEIT